jgi:hypothetical protein
MTIEVWTGQKWRLTEQKNGATEQFFFLTEQK